MSKENALAEVGIYLRPRAGAPVHAFCGVASNIRSCFVLDANSTQRRKCSRFADAVGFTLASRVLYYTLTPTQHVIIMIIAHTRTLRRRRALTHHAHARCNYCATSTLLNAPQPDLWCVVWKNKSKCVCPLYTPDTTYDYSIISREWGLIWHLAARKARRSNTNSSGGNRWNYYDKCAR